MLFPLPPLLPQLDLTRFRQLPSGHERSGSRGRGRGARVIERVHRFPEILACIMQAFERIADPDCRSQDQPPFCLQGGRRRRVSRRICRGDTPPMDAITDNCGVADFVSRPVSPFKIRDQMADTSELPVDVIGIWKHQIPRMFVVRTSVRIAYATASLDRQESELRG